MEFGEGIQNKHNILLLTPNCLIANNSSLGYDYYKRPYILKNLKIIKSDTKRHLSFINKMKVKG